MKINALISSHGLIATVVTFICFVIVIEASYPGYLNPDSVAHLEQAAAGSYDDWQSPYPKLILSVIIKTQAGPLGFIVLTNLLIWGSFLGLTLVLRPLFGRWTLLFLVVPLLPGTFNFLGNVHVDVLLVAWLTAAVLSAYIANNLSLTPRIRLIAQLLANIFLVAAFLTRLNVIFAEVPLLLYANHRLGTRRNLALSIAILLTLPILYKTQNILIEARPMTPSDSIKVYNLLALSHYTGENLLPGKWTKEQERKIIQACYSPLQWDTAWYGTCNFIYRELVEQQLWGSRHLTHYWLREILHNPFAYFSVLSANFKQSMFVPQSQRMLYQTPNRWNWKVVDDPPRMFTRLTETYIRSSAIDFLSRPFIFVFLIVTNIVLGFRTRIMRNEEGIFALALLTSGLVYLLTYFPFNVSAEYRYFYWSGFATYLGTLTLLLAQLHTSPTSLIESNKEHKWVRITTLVLAALATALVIFPFRAPVERFIIRILPLEERLVVVRGIHNAATPKWKLKDPFEGEINAPGWIAQNKGAYRANPPPFTEMVAKLETLSQDIEIHFDVGPNFGKVLIEGNDFSSIVDTRGDIPGNKIIVIPAEPIQPDKVQRLTTRNLVNATLIFLVLLLLLVRLSVSPVR